LAAFQGYQIVMRKTIRILSYYTIVIMLYTVFIPLIMTTIEDASPLLIVQYLFFIPVIALAIMVILETRWRYRRIVMAIFAVYTAAFFLRYIGAFIPPHDPILVIGAVLHIPIVAFAGLVLVALKRKAI
jgi:hypothetical protein